LVLLAVGTLAAVLVTPQDIKLRYLTFFSTHMADVKTTKALEQQAMAVGSTNERLYLLTTSILFTFQHPLVGVGPDQFAVAEQRYAIGSGKAKGSWLGTHNTYTQISSESGIPALVLYVLCMLACRKELAFVTKLCKTAPQTLDTREIEVTAFTLKMMLLCFAVFYMFEHIAYLPLFPALAGLILAFTRTSRAYFAPLQKLAPETRTMAAPVFMGAIR
jgi:O-antigen ligase